MIDSKIKIKHIFKIILELAFYYWGILFVFLKFFPNFIDFSSYPDLIYTQLVLKNWFIENYLVLYLLVPILNHLFNNLSQKIIRNYLILFGILWFAIPAFTYEIHCAGSPLMEFIYLYFIGGYIKRYGIPFFKSLNNQIFMILISCASVIGWLTICAIFHLNKLSWWFHLSWTGSIFTLLISLAIFCFFKNLDIKLNKTINFFAGSSLAVYLITGNRCIHHIIWSKWFYCTDHLTIPYLFVNIVISTIIAYILCTLIDKLKNLLLMNRINKFISEQKFIDRIEKFIYNQA